MNPKNSIVMLGIFFALVFASRAGAHPASGIVLDRDGNAYFSDLETIWKIDTNGKLSIFRPGVSGRHVHELAIDEQDNIYGAEISYQAEKWISSIWTMTPAGSFKYLLKPTDNPPRGMSIWRDRDGNSYFIDQNNHTKTQTLLLRRTPTGEVTTLAGGAYGQADGKGSEAKFSSVGNLAFGPDGSLYVTDGAAVRRITLDGTVVTLVRGLDARRKDDKPSTFGGDYGNLTGLAVDAGGNVYVADMGNRRLFKIDREGSATVLLRTDPPYSPNGVAVRASGEVYVLEVGFTVPPSWSGPRVRKITPDGKSTILATIGAEPEGANPKAVVARNAGIAVEGLLSFFMVGNRLRNGAILLSVMVFGTGTIMWRRRKRMSA